MARRLSSRIGWVMAAVVAAAAPAHASVGDLETAVKATYLYKFAPFVFWPPSALPGDDPLVICLQGQDPFGAVIDRAVAGQRVGSHPIVVRRMSRIDRASGCHIAYVGGSPYQSPYQALAAVEGAPVLTVTDASHGSARGIVHLMLDGGKVRFAVNTARADASGLGISSKLLALAVQVSR